MEKLALLGGKPIRRQPYPTYNNIGKEEKSAVLKVMDTKILSDFVGSPGNKFLGGKYVKKLERVMCDYLNVKYAVTYNSASTALQASIAMLGIGPGDEVITSPYTMTSTASAILFNNAIPVFADIDKDNYCLDWRSVEKNVTKRTKAILTVNLFGGSTDFDRILPLAKKYHLKIIEDNAQSFGAKYKNKYLGTIGDIGVFSFNVHKNLQCGEGGVITTNDPKLAFRAQLIRNHGEVVVDALCDSDEKNYEILVGNNFRLSELHAAIAIEQVKKRHKLINPCIKMADYLNRKIKKFYWLEGVKVLKDTTHTYYVYPFKFFTEKIGISRDTFSAAMLAENMPIHAGYTKPLYLIRLYQRRQIFQRSKFPFESKEYPTNVEYHKGICPQVEHLEEKEMMFTTICHPPQTTKDIDLWIHALEKVEDQRHDLIAYEKRRKK